MSHTLAVIVMPLYIAIIAILVIKKYNSVFVFLISDMMVLLLSAASSGGSIMGDKTTGNAVIGVFTYVTNTLKSNAPGVRLTLMVVTGYAVYMSHVGASAKLTYLATKPLPKIKNPYIVLNMLLIIGTLLKLVITSHAGLAMPLMAITFPTLAPLGISRLSAATVMIMCGLVDWGPNDSSAIFAAESVVGMPMTNYFLTYQGKAAAILILICAALPPIYLRHIDEKDASTGSVATKTEMPRDSSCPACYAVFPIVPLVLIAVFSFIPFIKVDVVTANFPGLFFVLILELVRRRDRKEVANDFNVVMKAMGNSFVNVVGILIGAAVFAETIKLLDGITTIFNVLAPAKSAPITTTALMSMIAFFVGMFLGSGNVPWYAFGPLVPNVAAQMGVSTATITPPMQLSSGIGRCMFPVAGAVIAIPGMTELEIMDIVEWCSVPTIVMFACNTIVSYVIV